jgi:glutaryl-CoA dehydrogenase (non-decarboxylating)
VISFELSDDDRGVEALVRDWAAREVLPRIHDLDRQRRFEPAFLKGMADLHLLGICIPEEYGGAGMDYISLGLASEELEYVDTHLRVILSVHVALNSMTLWCWGTEGQKRKYLVPDAGSDAVGIQMSAVRKGDRYVLNGEKTWISLADVADNYLVIAWTDPDKKRKRDHSGLSAFIVERGFEGFSSYTMKEKWGILAGNTGGFHLEDVEVPAENLVGKEGEGFRIAMFALENGRYTVAAGATGLIRACRDASVHYAKARKAFGVVSDYEAARLLWLRAGWLKNEGRRNTRETSLAKWFATVKSERCASDCVQIHGGNGFSDEYPAGRFFRNAKAAVIYEGTREIHKIMQADYALGYRQDRPRRVELPAYRR